MGQVTRAQAHKTPQHAGVKKQGKTMIKRVHTCGRLHPEQIVGRSINELIGEGTLEHLLKAIVIAVHVHAYYRNVLETERNFGNALPKFIERANTTRKGCRARSKRADSEIYSWAGLNGAELTA